MATGSHSSISGSSFGDAFNRGSGGSGGGGSGGRSGGTGAWTNDVVPAGLLDKRFNASESGSALAAEKAKRAWEQRPKEAGDVQVG